MNIKTRRAGLLVWALVFGAACSTPAPRSDQAPGVPADAKEAAAAAASATPIQYATDVLIRLAVSEDAESLRAQMVYAAGLTMMADARVEDDILQELREANMASFAPPHWGWATSHSKDPRLVAVVDSAEARGVPAQAVFEAFLHSGPPEMMREDESLANVKSLASQVEAPTRAETIATVDALAGHAENASSEALQPPSGEAATMVVLHMLGASGWSDIEENEQFTLESVEALRAEFAEVGVQNNESVESILSFVEDQICTMWAMWREYPDLAPKPEHDRGCSSREP